MKNFFKDVNGLRVIQGMMIAAIAMLAYYKLDGWGWLIFALIITL